MQTEKTKSLISFLLCTLMVVVLFLAFVGVKHWLISNYKVMQSSMEPTLFEGDVVWANKVKKPTYGDIVLVEVTEGNTTDVLIKRAVAFGGDLVWVEKSEVENGWYFLCVKKKDSAREDRYLRETYDGVTLDLMGYGALPTRDDGFAAVGEQYAIEVPANHIYCIGDNRNNSYDSRQFGAVSQDILVGVVVAKGMGVFWAITIPVAVILLAAGLLTYFPFKSNKKQKENK